MIIGLASDHAGYPLKEHITNFLKDKYKLLNYGVNNPEKSVDYPQYAQILCQELLEHKTQKGILVCGSGIGISIAANRFKGIRAALCHDLFSARLSREHNDANVLCLGNWFVTPKLAEEILEIWLNTPFKGVRHERRVKMLDEIHR